MDENSLLQFFQNNMSLLETVVPTISATLFTSLFLRYNTRTTEIEKLKAEKFNELSEELIKQGKMTHMEYFHWNKYYEIAKKADKYLKEKNVPINPNQKYDFEWFVRFYDYTNSITNEEMLNIWAAILAGEINAPGSISYSLLHALFMMRKEDAQIFENTCRFVLCDINDQPHPFIFIARNRNAYARYNITPSALRKLERLGLIDCDFSNEYTFQHEDKYARLNQTKVRKIFRTGNKQVSVYSDPANTNVIQAGNVVFTQDGEMLYSILKDSFNHYRADVLDFIVDRLRNRNCAVTINDKSI